MALSVYTRTRHFDKASLAWPSIFVLRVDVLDGYADHLEEELYLLSRTAYRGLSFSHKEFVHLDHGAIVCGTTQTVKIVNQVRIGQISDRISKEITDIVLFCRVV